MKRRLKINGFIIFLVVLLIVIFPKMFFRSQRESFLDEFVEIFGVAFILLGQLFRASARGYKSEHSNQGNLLIQDGPYALVRNPMYLGIFLIGLGIVLMLFKWWVAYIFLLIFVIRYVLLIFKEEKKLLALFPKDYPDYQKRVPRLIPSLNAFLQNDMHRFMPLKLSWIKKEIGSILAVLFITLLLESWEDIKHEGMGVYFKETIGMFVVIILFICVVGYLSKKTNNKSGNVSVKSKTNL